MSFSSYLPNKSYILHKLLMNTITDGNIKAVRYYLLYGALVSFNDYEVFMHACKCGNIDIVRYLYSNMRTYKINKSSKRRGRSFSMSDIRLYTADDKNEKSKILSQAMCVAADHGHANIVEYLHKHGADPLYNNQEAMLIALTNKHFHIVQLLVSYLNLNVIKPTPRSPIKKVRNNSKVPVKVIGFKVNNNDIYKRQTINYRS